MRPMGGRPREGLIILAMVSGTHCSKRQMGHHFGKPALYETVSFCMPCIGLPELAEPSGAARNRSDLGIGTGW